MLFREFLVLLRCRRGGRLTTSARSRCSRSRHQGRHLGGEHLEEAAEVLGVPGAGEVGLAEPDQLVAAEPGEELLGPVHDGHRAAAAVGAVAHHAR